MIVILTVELDVPRCVLAGLHHIGTKAVIPTAQLCTWCEAMVHTGRNHGNQVSSSGPMWHCGGSLEMGWRDSDSYTKGTTATDRHWRLLLFSCKAWLFPCVWCLRQGWIEWCSLRAVLPSGSLGLMDQSAAFHWPIGWRDYWHRIFHSYVFWWFLALSFCAFPLEIPLVCGAADTAHRRMDLQYCCQIVLQLQDF